MSLLSRLTTALRVATSPDLSEAVGRALVDQDSVRQGFGILAEMFPTGGHHPRRHSRRIELAYDHLPTLRATISRIADSVAMPRWHLYRAVGTRGYRQGVVRAVHREEWKDDGTSGRWAAVADMVAEGDLEEVARHPLPDGVIHGGNDAVTGFDQRRLISIFGDTAGHGYQILDDNRAGVPFQSWVIPQSWCKRTPTPSYPFYEFRFRGWHRELRPENVIEHRNPSPANPYDRGSGAATALADELGADEMAARHIARWFFHGGNPPTVITGEGVKETDKQIRRAEANWVNRARRRIPIFLKGANWGVHKVGDTFRDQEMVNLRLRLRDVVLEALGMPPELMGILGKSNRSTIDKAEEIHARHNALPRLVRMAETLERIKPRYRGVRRNAVLMFDNPVRVDQEFRLKVARAQPHALKQSEWRRLSGHGRTEGDEVHLVTDRYQAHGRLDEVELVRPEGEDGTETEKGAAALSIVDEIVERLETALDEAA